VAVDGPVEEKLTSLGYKRLGRRLWRKGDKIVRVLGSSEDKRYVRILWREEWKDYHAIIFDYSRYEGPICVVLVDVLFKLPFVVEKRKQETYANNGYWCSQRFPRYHELTKFVLSHEERWGLL
jgi:hypothetical protein